jgi:hypothetical protein
MDNSKIQHLVGGKIPPELCYACSYWAIHLSHASVNDELSGLVENFALCHLLNWLEVLSLISHLDVAYPALQHARQFVVS